jgi:hypothetical protein
MSRSGRLDSTARAAAAAMAVRPTPEVAFTRWCWSIDIPIIRSLNLPYE